MSWREPEGSIQLVGRFGSFAKFLPRNADIEMRIRRFWIDRGRALEGLNRTFVVTAFPSCDSQADQAVGLRAVELNGAFEFRDGRFPIAVGDKLPAGLLMPGRLP